MSTKEYGCFYCEGKSFDENGNCNLCGREINISTFLKSNSISDYEIKDVLGRGFYGWTVRGNDGYNDFAIKILPEFRTISTVDKIADVKIKEAVNLSKCQGHKNIVPFFRPLTNKLNIEGQEYSIICLIYRFIPNPITLKDFYNTINELSDVDVINILIGITSAIKKLHDNGLQHFDLHNRNILIVEPSQDDNFVEKYLPIVIDFGSSRPLNNEGPENSQRSDFSYLSKHYFSLSAAFEKINYGNLTNAQRSFVANIKTLARQIADINPTRRIQDFERILKELSSIHRDILLKNKYPSFEEMLRNKNISFSEPLSNVNALSLLPQDITLLFKDRFDWAKKVKKSEPVIITGPRGCGKTMLLKFLSIISRARPLDEETLPEHVYKRLNRENSINFLFSFAERREFFSIDFYHKLLKHDLNLACDFSKEFIKCSILFEVTICLSWLQKEKILVLPEPTINSYIQNIKDLLNLSSIYIDSFEYLLTRIEKRIIELQSMSDITDYKQSLIVSNEIFETISSTLKTSDFFENKEIWFLLDDYSKTVIPEEVQKALNPSLFRVSTNYNIKISSEGSGPYLIDFFGRKYKEGREITFIDLGEIFFLEDETECILFIEDILKGRFENTKIGSLEKLKNLLGEHENNSNFGKYLIGLKKKGLAKFYGFELICRLCSGDMSYTIELFNSLVNGNWDAVVMINQNDQDRIIKQFATRQLEMLRNYSEIGPQLNLFTNSLGSLLRQNLSTRPKKGSKNKIVKPGEYLRIEVEGNDTLTEKAQNLLDFLLSNSVLINGGSGKSRDGKPTKKYYFRRLFAPCFPFSPNRSNSFALKYKDFNKWLEDPASIEKFNFDANLDNSMFERG